MDKTTYEMRMTQWTNIIQECNASGMQKKVWCRQNSIDEKQFYYWQRRIRNRAFEIQRVSEPTALAAAAPAFVEIPTKVSPSYKEALSVAATIRVGGCTIEISESASDSFLRSLLGALAYAK